ncbi:ArsR/SmtB family transcription factor, partial [Bacillus sp. HC-Mk]
SAKIVSSERKGLEIYYKVENETIIQLVRVLLG